MFPYKSAILLTLDVYNCDSNYESGVNKKSKHKFIPYFL